MFHYLYQSIIQTEAQVQLTLKEGLYEVMDTRRQGLEQPLLNLSTIQPLAFYPSPFLCDLLWPVRCESCDQVPVPNLGLWWPCSSLSLSQKLARLPWKQAQVSLLEHERCVEQVSPPNKCKDPETQGCLMCVMIRQKSDWGGNGKKWGWRSCQEPGKPWWGLQVLF